MAKTKSLTQYEVDNFEENDVGISCNGHWDNSLLDYGLTQLREYVTLLRKIGAKDCLAVVEELIAWVDADLQPHMSQFAVTDKDPHRLESSKLASDYCDKLLAALCQREIASVQAGYRAAQTDANKLTSTQALDARRIYQMSWS